MIPFWQRFLVGLAAEVLPDIWDAIRRGDSEKAMRLAGLAAQRKAEHDAAEEMLNRMSKKAKKR